MPRSNTVTKRMETKLVTYKIVDMRGKKLNQWQNHRRKKQYRRESREKEQ